MSVCLTDTTGDTDIHINDILLEDGYAVFEADNTVTSPEEKVRNF